MRKVGKVFSRVDTLLFKGVLVPQQVHDNVADDVADVVADADIEPTASLPTPAITPPPPQQELISSLPQLKQNVRKLEKKRKLKASRRMHPNRGKIADLDANQDVTLEEVDAEVLKDADSKDKGKGILVEEPKSLKKQAQIEHDKAYAKELEAEINENINWNEVIEQKLDEEVKELKTHLQIISNDEDDVYTEATPLALKVLVADYQIHTEHNKPYYKIIRADGTHQLFLSFIILLRNFDREDLEELW
nr:hypothetical protein [Tanacetum cinerariifolium]